MAARSLDKYEKGKTLANVAGRRGIVVDAHGAAGDAMTTALLVDALLGDIWSPGTRFVTVGGLLAFMRDDALRLEAEHCAFKAKQGSRG